MNVVRIALVAAIALTPVEVVAQVNACLQQTGKSVVPEDTWRRVFTEYLESLTTSRTAQEHARLTKLRGELIDLQVQKLHVIDILEAHLEPSSSGTTATGTGAGKAISTKEIPEILNRIDKIVADLNSMATRGNEFTGEAAFKDLKIELAGKRATTLCRVAAQLQSETPNKVEVQRLLDRLRGEFKGISDAEEQVGEYTRKRFGGRYDVSPENDGTRN